jgi:reactive intermediate/imine deaminase
MPYDIQTCNPASALTPLGHYSQAVRTGNLLFVSGQVAVKPDGSSLAHAPLGEQFEQAISNLRAIIEGAGSSLDRVVKVHVYLADPDGWPVVNEIYQRYFQHHRPARAVIPTSAFYGDFLVEIDAIAVVD